MKFISYFYYFSNKIDIDFNDIKNCAFKIR